MYEPQAIQSHDALIERVEEAFSTSPTTRNLLLRFIREMNYGGIRELLYNSFSDFPDVSKYAVVEILAQLTDSGELKPAFVAKLKTERKKERQLKKRDRLRRRLYADFKYTYCRRS